MSDNPPPAPAPPAETGALNTVTNISGGVNINAQGNVIITGDVVGRDYAVVPGDKNLSILMGKVKDFWVKGVLENSVHHAALIELGKQVRADAVEVDHPWETVVRTADQPDRTLPPDQKIVDVFDEMKGALLILGVPGSGKTTTLLELARDLIDRAEKDSTLLVPAVFNLSSWGEKRQKRSWNRQPQAERPQTVAEWLIDELRAKYGVPSKMGRQWIEHSDLILLLDGLDEVKAEHRRACVDAINTFRTECGMTGIVVCSRTREYEELASRLKLNGAVLIQPLTREQIDCYIAAGGSQLVALGSTMRTDAGLLELAQAPLMLNVMSLSYAGQSVDSLTSTPDDPAQLRKHLFGAYVDKMFDRTGRTAYEPYPRGDTVRWLVWLAARMSEHGQTVFLLEGMQPSLLQSSTQRLMYDVGSVLVGLLLSALFGMVLGALVGTAVSGLFLGLAGWSLAMGMPRIKWVGKNIELVESVDLSWLGLVLGLARGLALGLVVGLVVGLIDALLSGLRFGLGGVLNAMLVFALFGALVRGLFGGLKIKQIETKTKPNQGFWRSGGNALVVGLVVGLVAGLLGVLIGGLLIGGPRGGLVGGLLGALAGGLFGGLNFGGTTFIQHLILRFVLWRNGYIPRNYVRFLDFAADHIFLRKVGGGYIFIHRMLMEYFASLETQPSAESDK